MARWFWIVLVAAAGLGVLCGWVIVGIHGPSCSYSCPAEGPAYPACSGSMGCPSQSGLHWAAAVVVGVGVWFAISFFAGLLARRRPTQ